MSGEHIVRSAAQGIDLVGPPPQDTHPTPGFRQADFAIDRAAQQATCPAGQVSQVWSERQPPGDGPPGIRDPLCGGGLSGLSRLWPLHDQPAGPVAEPAPLPGSAASAAGRGGDRGLPYEVPPAGGDRGDDLRSDPRPRLASGPLRGLAKQLLQDCFTAIATNLKRLARWWAGRGAGVAGAAAG